MLSNNTFLETRIQRLHDGLIFVEKGLVVHVQCMLEMGRVFTLAEILSKIFVNKRRKIGNLIYDHALTFLETRIQRLHDGLIFVEKGLVVHVQCMLEMGRVFTLAEILSKIFVNKRRKIGNLIYDHALTN